jgi:phenylpropionate dioxygenase-like ring-hydroxylating dioxygenase large terminal subunit
MNKAVDIIPVEDLSEAVTYPVEAFISPEYAREEKKALWPHVWQHACRVEEIPEVGDYITYDVADESVIVIRVDEERIKAFHNVCQHRGRRLIDTPPGAMGARGNTRKFVCGFHSWAYDIEGKNTFVLDPQDWKGGLDKQCLDLSQVRAETWGGWVFINMDLDAEPLESFMGEAARRLNPFLLDKMRYKWRQWVVFDCNWKTAIEAFMEPYHVAGTHTQMLKWGQYYAYSEAHGAHGVSGFDERDKSLKMEQSSSITRAGKGADPRESTYQLQKEIYESVNNASTTMTLVNAARRLVDELPEGTPADEVVAHWMASARADDAARGVAWPEITPAQMGEAGLAWSIFPNMTILHGITFALCYRVRPHGDNPDQCIFESYAIERFPEGEAPETEWVYAEATAEKWGLVLSQDFSNMSQVQRGMKSSGFRRTLPNPHQERKVTNFHRNLAKWMGRGSPRLLDDV